METATKLRSAETLPPVGGDNRQYLTFRLDREEYGIEILRVQEIKGYDHLTPVPSTPHYMKGVMNLRGTVVPIIELRARFGMPEREVDQFTVIIVVNVGSRVVGLLVDTVSDVLDIPAEAICDTPDLAAGVEEQYLTGMGKVSDKLVMLLDLQKLIGAEVASLEEIAA
jgi:purine-binding chemotaxis protein CheW